MAELTQEIPDYDNMTDEELALKAKDGNAGAEEVLLRRYKKLVLSAASGYYIEGADRDDVVQEGMIGLFESIKDYDADKGASFATFASLCIKRQILNAVQGASRKKHRILNESLPLDDTIDGDEGGASGEINGVLSTGAMYDPELEAIGNETITKLLYKGSGVLSPFERRVWEMLALGASTQEIAETLGRSPKSIDNASQRIKGKIRNLLGR